MTAGQEATPARRPSLILWFVRKFVPTFLVAGIIGYTISFLSARHPSLLTTLSVVVGIGFGLFSLLYFYWAIEPNRPGRYRWGVVERLGIVLSGLGALGIGAKLVAPDTFPGSIIAYLIGGFLLAFVGRPILDSIGFRINNSEQVVADQRPARRESRLP